MGEFLSFFLLLLLNPCISCFALSLFVLILSLYRKIGVTADETFSKEKFLEKRQKAREESNLRRRERRVRERLANVLAGDKVQGYVQDLDERGILVTITSLGTLNMTALIPMESLPPQYETPKRELALSPTLFLLFFLL
jgi:hypothetical protein